MRRASFCAMILFLIGVGSMAHAAPTLSLTSPATLQTLQVNQTVTFEVHLSGLESQQELDSLSATIYYTDHLGSSAITPSGTIPSSGSFFSAGNNQASASFLATGDQSADRIHGNGGLFFSFDTVVQHSGLGYLWFDYADASQVNPAIYFSSSDVDYPVFCNPAIGSVLEFNVVPEPSTWVLLTAAGLTVAAYFLMRRKSAAFVR